MKISHILNHILRCGNGIVSVAVDLVYIQSKDGHDVTIASTGGEYEILLQKIGV